jgi:beta-glucosidase
VRDASLFNSNFVKLGLALTTAACSHLKPGGDLDTYPGGDGSVTWPVTFDGGTPLVGDAGPPVTKTACSDSTYADPWTPGYASDKAAESTVQSLVDEMTNTELADQMRGTTTGGLTNFADIFRSPEDPTKGIRGFHFRDGPRGVCLAAELPEGKNGYSTAFPVPEARAAAFDMDLEYQIGEAIADEVVASIDPTNGQHNNLVLAPVINILRHPAWGRAQETYGEDSFLLGRMGTAFTAGAQTYIPACAKHFAAYDIEDGRSANNSRMDEQTLREHYAAHFGMVVRDAGVSCIMAAYNLVTVPLDGTPTKSAADKHLLTDILRGDFGYEGFVLSDWWAMSPGTAFATTDTLQANAAAGVSAGMDMELPWSYNYAELEAISGPNGSIEPFQILESSSRILRQKYRFNVANLGKPIVGLRAPTTTFSQLDSIENNADHIALARRTAIEGMVLLKNDNATLPIKRSSVKTVAVVGGSVNFHLNFGNLNGTIDFTTEVRLGDLGSSRVFSDPAKSSGPFAGIQAAAGSSIQVVRGNDASIAQNADFVVVVVGLTPEDEGEEYTGAGDRFSFALDAKSMNHPTLQNDLVKAVAALHKPMAVVIEAGSVIDMPWLSQVPAVVMAWYPGMDGGNALGQLLFGDADFGGKLPMTWPQKWTDEPPFTQGSTTDFDYYVGYQYFDHYLKTPRGDGSFPAPPLFPFGYGLSYTTFSYGNLQVPCSTVSQNGVVYVQADVTNTGPVAGDDVAFLFVSYPGATARRPVKELKGFQRVSLDPGQTKRVTLPLRISDLRYWDNAAAQWQPSTGTVQIMVGPSSDNLPLKDTLTVQ